jgi:hypothetical protein
MMPYVEGYYQELERRTAQAEGELKKAARPVTKLLSTRTSMATKKLSAATQPVADMLAERTAAAQRGMLDFPIPVGPAAPKMPALDWYWWERG